MQHTLIIAAFIITAILTGCDSKLESEFSEVSFFSKAGELKNQGFDCTTETVQDKAIINCKRKSPAAYLFGFNSSAVEVLYSDQDSPPTAIIAQLPAEAAEPAKKAGLFKQIESSYGDRNPEIVTLPDGELRQWRRQDGAQLQYISMKGIGGSDKTRVILSMMVPNPRK